MRLSWWIVLSLLPVLMADIPSAGGGFMEGLLGILGGIASAIRGWFAITAEQLLRLMNFLKDTILKLSQQLVVGLFRLGRVVARAVRALVTLAARGVRDLAVWAYHKIQDLSAWLREKFGPALRFIQKLKDRLHQIYQRFVKPVIDTIEFIRQLNRILQVFHIDILKSLDRVLSQVEQRIEQPFLWVEKKLTEIQNWINRIITLDGLLQKATLIASMSRYVPSWLRIAVAARQRELTGDEGAVLHRAVTVQPTGELIDDLVAYMAGESNDVGDTINAAVDRALALYEELG